MKAITTRNELMKFAERTMEECLKLARAKNEDYARADDPFGNLRRGGVFGVAVRLDDKVSRALNLANGKIPAVKDETLRETFKDILNYAWLGLALMEGEGDE